MIINILSPAQLCRFDENLINNIIEKKNLKKIFVSLIFWIIVGSSIYGCVFGIWRSGFQALLSFIKLPILIFSVVILSSSIDIIMGNILGARLNGLQILICILLSLSITSIILGVLSPPVLFFVYQFPSCKAQNAVETYRQLLLMHTILIGISGTIGCLYLYKILSRLTNSSIIAKRIIFVWILVACFVGFEMSWILSPFLALPDAPVFYLNPDAFKRNVFEYLWYAIINM